MSRDALLIFATFGLCVVAGCQVAPISQATLAEPAKTAAGDSEFNPLNSLEKSLVFAPTKYPKGDWQPVGLKFEDAWFEAADGTRLHGWFLPQSQPRAVLLYCHGNGGNVAMWGSELHRLHDRFRLAVLGFDYRGYGRSEGTPSEAGILSDARAARAWLARRADVPESQIVMMGRSLGGAVAVDLAAKDGTRGLILESTFTSMPEVGHAMAPWLPLRSLMKTQLNSQAKIASYHGPLLQSHGTADRLIPFTMGKQLFDTANEPKRFVSIQGGDHNDPQSAEYYAALGEFLDRLR